MRCALFAALIFCAGCGGTTVRTVTAPVASRARCVTISGLSNFAYDVCNRTTIRFNGKPLAIPRPVGSGRVGGWIAGYVSRDAKTLLLQWSAECEVPYAFFVSARGGTPRLVTGERSIAQAPESIADGWTEDGRAIVELPKGPCGNGAGVPGIYFITTGGRRTLVQRLPAHA